MIESVVCMLAQLGIELRSMGVMVAAVVATVVFFIFLLVRRMVGTRRMKEDAPLGTAPWVYAGGLAIAVYTFARVIDPLLASRLARPSDIPVERFERISWFEWQLLGDSFARALLPLADQLAVAILVHLVLWSLTIAFLRTVLVFLHPHARYSTPPNELPWFYRYTGAVTARRPDDRFRSWMRRVVLNAIPLLYLVGWLMASSAADAGGQTHSIACGGAPQIESLTPAMDEELARALDGLSGQPPDSTPPSARAAEEAREFVDSFAVHGVGSALLPSGVGPAPGTFVLIALFLLLMTAHLLAEGRPPASDEEQEEEETDDEEEEHAPHPAPLAKLGDAIRERIPSAQLAALTRELSFAGERASFPEAMSPLVRELFDALAGGEELYTHQAELLTHLCDVWRMESLVSRGETPRLDEEALASPIKRSDASPHALLATAEGSGRTTAAMLAVMHLHLDRGATSLVVLRERSDAREWAENLRRALVSSSTRWNIEVAVAGDDLAASLLAGKTPAVVVAALDELEQSVLGDARTDEFFQRLGLIVADDLDGFFGVAEMHLHLVMRRLWALLDHRHDAPYPPVLIATLAPGPDVDVWARHILAAPLRVFDEDAAPRSERVIVRQADLVDGRGQSLSLRAIAEACSEAKIPWHLRFAGDVARRRRPAELELSRLRRHHVDDPKFAEVVLIEGPFFEVRREVSRLCHAGLAVEGPVVLVMDPPAEEEVAFHEEAVDAEARELLASLPRSLPLAEPDLLRQRHFDRALGREQDVEALQRRFGRDFVDRTLDHLDELGKLSFRKVHYFDPRADDARSRSLVRAVGEEGIGEPIDSRCVSEAADCIDLVDTGTSDVVGRLDRATAIAHLPPGAVTLLPTGRFVIQAEENGALPAEHAPEPRKTVSQRFVSVELPADVEWSERQLGGRPVRVAVSRGVVTETLLGMRTYDRLAQLVEQRAYEAPLRAEYGTQLCLVRCGLPRENAFAPLGREGLAALVAALRLALPSYLRGGRGLIDVASVPLEVGHEASAPYLVFFDRTPGASGFANHLFQRGLKDAFRLARLVLERLVGEERDRLRSLYSFAEQESLDAPEALRFLDYALDPVLVRRAARRLGPRSAYTEGEGTAGDLGRLWVSKTGRTDDLVWTRHEFFAPAPLPPHTQEAGQVFFDFAVERRAILQSIRAAADAGVPPRPVAPRDAKEWSATHAPLVSTDALTPFVATLQELTGDGYVDAVLRLVAAIPTSQKTLSATQRAPLAVLCRRVADADAKVVLAVALLRGAANPEVTVDDEGVLLTVTIESGRETFDLALGPALHIATPRGDLAVLS